MCHEWALTMHRSCHWARVNDIEGVFVAIYANVLCVSRCFGLCCLFVLCCDHEKKGPLHILSISMQHKSQEQGLRHINPVSVIRNNLLLNYTADCQIRYVKRRTDTGEFLEKWAFAVQAPGCFAIYILFTFKQFNLLAGK